MSRRNLPALAAALSLPALLVPSGAVAAPKQKSAGAVARFEIVRVDVRGEQRSRLVDDATVYDYRGIARYDTSVDEQGELVIPPPARRRLPQALTIGGLEYNGLSDAKITMSSGVDDCSMETAGAIAPNRIGALVAFKGGRMLVNWMLVPPLKRCPPDALVWTIPSTPSKAMVQRYSLTRLLKVKRGRETRLAIKIQHRWSDHDGDHRVRWSGYVQLARVR